MAEFTDFCRLGRYRPLNMDGWWARLVTKCRRIN